MKPVNSKPSAERNFRRQRRSDELLKVVKGLGETSSSKAFVRPDLQAHIYSEALLSNLSQLKRLCGLDTKFCAVVKANAYGHGMTQVVNILSNTDIDFYAVAGIFEALHIANLVEKQSILILKPIHCAISAEQIVLCARNDFHCSIASVASAEYISKILADSDYILKLHVNIETGMGRCGLDADEALELIHTIDASRNMQLAGVFTHFATADEDDLSFVYEQLKIFNQFLAYSGIRNRKDVLIHAANSAATIKVPQSHFDMVRCGIALYGYFSRPQKSEPIKLSPVMKLQAPIIHLKRIAKGKSLSYGRSFFTSRDTLAAVVPLGYADGYWRRFSNRAKMKLADTFVPVIGRVCMDQLLVDVTDVRNARVGQMITVLDNEHSSACGVYALADLAETICYEVLTSVEAHVNRIVH